MGIRLNRWMLNGLITALGVAWGLGSLPVQAQFSDFQVGTLVDALREANPDSTDQTYNEWQTENIPRWSEKCLGRSLTADLFTASPVTARAILVCTLRDVVRTEYQTGGNNTAIAIRRAAAWWITGNPNRYSTGDIADYSRKVLSLYRQKQPAATAPKPAIAPGSSKPTPQPAAPTPVSAQPGTPPNSAQAGSKSPSSFYDRYMQAGYEATQKKQRETALLYFQRALDERPDDAYATQAIRNVETYLGRSPAKPAVTATPEAKKTTAPTKLAPPPAPVSAAPTPRVSSSVSAPSATVEVSAKPNPATLTQDKAIELVNRWLAAKADIFAPPFDQQQILNLTTGELLSSLLKPDGVLIWLKNNRAYYRYGVQQIESVERFVATRDRATIELKVIEDRTLYFNGAVDPKRTDFSTQQIRFSLEIADGTWKVADYKTVEGSLLERAIADTGQRGF